MDAAMLRAIAFLAFLKTFGVARTGKSNSVSVPACLSISCHRSISKLMPITPVVRNSIASVSFKKRLANWESVGSWPNSMTVL